MYLEKVAIVTKDSDNELGMRLWSILNQFKGIHLFFDWIIQFLQVLELCNISNFTVFMIKYIVKVNRTALIWLE